MTGVQVAAEYTGDSRRGTQRGQAGMTTEEERMRARVAADLRIAMKTRDAFRVGTLRSLAAALDNATAVPMRSRMAASENSEVPRKALSPEDIRAVVIREIAERRDAASMLGGHARFEEVARLEAQIKVLQRYLDGS